MTWKRMVAFLIIVGSLFVSFECLRASMWLFNQPADGALFVAVLVLLLALVFGVYGLSRGALVAWDVSRSLYGMARTQIDQRLVQRVVLVCIFGAGLSGCTRVGPGYVGIKVSMAGDNKGVDSAPAVTGWAFYNPFLSSVYEYPTFVQTAVWTASLTEGKAANEEITFTNADQMQIAADISLAYHLDPEKVPAFYVKFRSDDLAGFTHGFLRNLARDQFDKHAGKYSIEQIMGDNAAFMADVRVGLQDEVQSVGVELDQFGFIGAPRPPPAVIEAINAKVHATQLAQQKQNELVQAQADAAKVVAKAKGDAEALMVQATAQAQANRLVAASLTSELVQVKALEKWTGTLPTLTGGAIPFINVTASR